MIAAGHAATPEHVLAGAFASRIVRWAREGDGNAGEATLEALYATAYATSLATAGGHVCTYLAEIAASSEGRFDERALRRALEQSGMVGTPEERGNRPLGLDREGRVYIHRYFDYESRLAKRLVAASSGAPRPIGPEVRALLGELYAGNAKRLGRRPDSQRIATELALERRLAVVSGGPGTGKTTTVANLLACAITRDPDCRIALAAPTGKAAARMQEAIRANSRHLPAELRERLPDEAHTVHRLLGVLPESRGFRHRADNPLAIDVLVVDEASMLDLALAAKLLEAVPEAAHIVLLGDKDQLAAVESGAVFSELAAPVQPAGLAGSVVWLGENFRFAPDSGIGRFAAHVNAGEAREAIEQLRVGHDAALTWVEDADPAPRPATLERVIEGMAPYLDAARRALDDPAPLFDALGAFRVLCAEREGPRGAEGLNRFMGERFRDTLDHRLDPGRRSPWYPGRPVMVLRNDYVLKLFNGDVGIALPDVDDGLLVHFPQRDGGFRAVAPLRLPEHETAFATTVHKAQGSEFDRVMLMLPAQPTRVVTRELLYTAVTRARTGVTVVGGVEVVDKAVTSPTRRYSGLGARLAEARAALVPADERPHLPSVPLQADLFDPSSP